MTTNTPDLLELYEAEEFEQIEAILDSAEYTKAEKIAMITKKNLFSELCVYVDYAYDWEEEPVELLIKVLRILGENLGDYVDELKNIATINNKGKKEKLLRVIVEELSDFQFTDILTSLLVYSFRTISIAIVNVFLSSESVKQNILTQKFIKYKYDIKTKHTKEIILCNNDNDTADTDYVFYEHATLLEIALQKHVSYEIIRALVQVGGKGLLLLSERSLIQGVMIEHNSHISDKEVEIVKLFLEVGGKDLVMKEKSWHEHDANAGLNIFEFLCEYGKYYLNIGDVAKVMTMLLDTGGNDLVMKKNKKGQTILHFFKYFHRYDLFMSVVERIKEIGGVDLTSIADNNGDTVLHTLAKYYPQNKSDDVVGLEWWEILACDEDLVMMQNKDGKTALHIACENSEVNAIKVLVEKGGRDLVWKRDNQMNTALHLLSFRVSREKDADNFQALKHLVEVGGMKLLHSLNSKEKKPVSPFFIDAIEFQFDEENRRAKAKALQEEAKLDQKAKLDLEKQLQAVQKKNSKLEWKWTNRKKMQRSEKKLEEAVKSLKNELKALKKDNDSLNDTIKELQKEKDSELMDRIASTTYRQQLHKNETAVMLNGLSKFQKKKKKKKQLQNLLLPSSYYNREKADIKNQLNDEIKHLQGKQQSLQSKLQEKQDVIENLQNERKQADLEFETVKTMHEENKCAYEKSLVEVRNLKEVERSQQDDIRDQKEMIQNLQYELGQKDEEYTLRLRNLEEENQRLRDINDKEEVPYTDKPSSIQEESQRLIEEVKANIDEESSIENRVRSLEEENKTLKDAVKEQKQIATEKQNENKALKDENERLVEKIATSSLKRSRGVESEEIDCIEEDEDDIFCPPTKRGKLTSTSSKTRSSENTRNEVASLESEIEELINDLEYEKTSHTKTLKRLKEARKSSKKN